MTRRAGGRETEPVDQLIESFGVEELVEVVTTAAAERPDDVAAAVRLVALAEGVHKRSPLWLTHNASA